MNLHERLVQLRKMHGYTQKRVAEALGISRGAYANYEIGTRKPDPESLSAIAEFYGVSIDYLLGRTDHPQRITSPDQKSELGIFSHRLRALREKRGMTLQELAERVGITPSYLHKLETNPSRFPGVSTLQRLAETLGVTAAYLVGDVSDPNDRGPLDAWYQPKDLVKFLDESEMVMFDGRPLTEEDKQRIKDILAAVFMDAKQRNKRKK